MKYFVLLLLASCAAVPVKNTCEYKMAMEAEIRRNLQICLYVVSKSGPNYVPREQLQQELCFWRADNDCMNNDLEPDCHGIMRP